MKNARRKKMVWICIVTLIAALSWSIAWADFYVVASGGKAKKTILVSPESTETASGTALLNALNGITDAGATNPYLVIIEPGIYDIGTSSLQMKAYVDIQGSGEEVTKITGDTGSASSGVLEGADNAEVRFLTVENTGGGSNAICIYNSSVSPAITHVTATASGGEYNCGVYNTSSYPTMTHVTVTAWDPEEGTDSIGVYNTSSSPTMTNVTATASGGGNNCGVRNILSSPTMTNVTANASGGTENHGIRNSNSSSPTMTNIIATATAGITNYGVYNHSSASPTMTNVIATALGGSGLNYGVWNTSSSGGEIDHSVLSGDDAALYNNASGATTCIGNTRLSGDVSGPGLTRCAGVYDGDFTFYASTCP